MRQVAAGEILISYSQICAFDPSLDRPFNDWTPRHAVQGFAWRPGSVAFRVDEDAGDGGVVRVRVSVATSPPDVVGAAGAVRVPFEAPAEGAVEIASISESLPAKVPPGPYDLYFIDRGPELDFVFAPSTGRGPDVLVGSERARPQAANLMEAEPG
jgi:hypothetical protein